MNKKATLSRIKAVLKQERLGVLATIGKAYPYQNIVSYAASGDLGKLIFATSRASVKYANIKRCPRVTMFVDSRGKGEADLSEAVGITALGHARELSGAEARKEKRSFLARHPYLEDFVLSPGVALFALRIKAYYVVTRFQEAEEVVMR